MCLLGRHSTGALRIGDNVAMSSKAIEDAVHDVISAFCRKLVRDALDHAQASLSTFTPSPWRASGPALPRTRLIELPLPAERAAGPVHAPEYVDRLVELVRNHPWPPQSRELQALLGVRKDPFLRIVTLALETGRITRTGSRSSVRYHLA